MSVENRRQQGADACRAYFAAHSTDLTELCADGQGDMVMKALVTMASSPAAEAVGILNVAGMQIYAEGYVEQVISEVEALRGKLLIVVP